MGNLPQFDGVQWSEEADKLIAALGKFQGQVETIPATTQAYKYSYADLASVMDATRDLATECQLVVLQVPSVGPEVVLMQTTLFHTPSMQWVAMTHEWPVTDSSPQGIGSLLTYTRRYARLAILGLAQVGADDDGQAAQPKRTERTIGHPPARRTSTQAAAPAPDVDPAWLDTWELEGKTLQEVCAAAHLCQTISQVWDFYRLVQNQGAPQHVETWPEVLKAIQQTYKWAAGQRPRDRDPEIEAELKAEGDRAEKARLDAAAATMLGGGEDEQGNGNGTGEIQPEAVIQEGAPD